MYVIEFWQIIAVSILMLIDLSEARSGLIINASSLVHSFLHSFAEVISLCKTHLIINAVNILILIDLGEHIAFLSAEVSDVFITPALIRRR